MTRAHLPLYSCCKAEISNFLATYRKNATLKEQCWCSITCFQSLQNGLFRIQALRFQAFDQPSEDAITGIAAPEGVLVTIGRDVFGKTMAISRSGGKSLTRSYVYDVHQRLCKTIEPETGATIQAYDAASNISWRATGLALPSTGSCDEASVPAAQKMSFGYDLRNRLETTTFGDNSPAIARTYTPDGQLKTIASGGALWTYDYNKRQLNWRETLAYGGRNYTITRAYDANASVSQLTYPVDNLTLNYNPNAFGGVRQVGGYATGIEYHPNGAVAAFNYGNGIRRTMNQNIRGLPERSLDNGVLNDRYTYDANGNPDNIVDDLEGVATRAMAYDGLDRLRTVSAPNLWGTASYGYAALDNLVSTSISGGASARTLTHTVDPLTNRLQSVSGGPASFNFSYGYDIQGNVTRRGAQTYRFD